MNLRSPSPGRIGPLYAAAVLTALASGGLMYAADGVVAGPEPRAVVARCVSADGTLLSREPNGTDWKPVAKKVMVSSRDVLLALPGVQAVVETEPPGIALTLYGGWPQLSPSPVLESEVALHDSRAYDLDFTLRAGRVLLTNTKEKGPARVWVRLPGFAWQLTLTEPGTRVGLEIYGRWPHGIRFSKEERLGEQPTKVLALLMFKGQAQLQTDTHSYELSAPPGPALMTWDSVAGEASGPQRLKELPAWADPNVLVPAEGKAVEEVVRGYQTRLKKTGSPEEALTELLDAAATEKDKSRAADMREFAVLGYNALNELPRVAEALADPHSADVRDAAVLGLRTWIGANSGRDQQLYRLLQDHLGYTDHQAEAVLDLLHSPFDADNPATYEALIRLLQHPKLAVRQLARWHLYRLAPVGRDIAYDPAAPQEEREKAVKAWQELVPSGELPKEKKIKTNDERRKP
jgi:hypothetical protein